jgi:hypothetical protein
MASGIIGSFDLKRVMAWDVLDNRMYDRLEADDPRIQISRLILIQRLLEVQTIT